MTYFDIDSILAEEELVPCTTLFDFSHLGHLDDSSSSSSSMAIGPTTTTTTTTTQYLKEGTKLKMPLWAMDKWSSLRYVKVHVPRHMNQTARERWEADPLAVDLRKHNPHFFRAANRVIAILEQSSTMSMDSTDNNNTNNNINNNNNNKAAMDSLRRILLQTYTGPRLRATLDWSWYEHASSSSADSGGSSKYMQTLTEMERKLFRAGASGTGAHLDWKQRGRASRRRQQQVKTIPQRPLPLAGLLERGPVEKRQRVN